jgi:hypothetical protein
MGVAACKLASYAKNVTVLTSRPLSGNKAAVVWS